MPTLDETLAEIGGDLKALREREAGGEDVSAEIAKKEAEAKSVKAALAEDERDELVRLRAEKSEAEERSLAQKAVRDTLGAIQDAESQRQERIRKFAQEEVAKALGGKDLSGAIKSVLDERGGSRYVGPDADPSLVEHVAKGGTVETHKRYYASAKGGAKIADAMKDATIDKKMLTFFGAIARNSKNVASDADREWLGEINSKALAEGTASSGGYLVPQEWMPDILGLLRGEAVVRRAGPRIVPFNKQMNQTSVSTGATAYYTAENARITPSEETFAEVPILTPKNLTGLVPVSNYLLHDAPQAEGFVRADLVEVMALREDLAFLRGTGTGGEPTGFRNMSSITLNPVTVPANGLSITLAQTRRMKAVYRTLNARQVRLAWFFNPAFITYLETLVDTQGRFLADANILQINDDQMSGTFDGVPFFATNQLPANQTQGTSTNASELYLVNMAEAIVGENMSLEIDVSSEASYTPDGGTTWISAFQNAQTLFRAIMRHDITHRRPTQVIVQTGVLV
jgi:HK97 family phage major capsid protein